MITTCSKGSYIIAELYELTNITEDATANIVFVHGLGNEGEKAFAMADIPSWKTLLEKDFPKARLWIFDYDASPTTLFKKDSGALPISQRARTFSQELDLAKDDFADIPLIFVAYSLGGLVVKHLLVATESRGTTGPIPWLTEVCKGVSFIATPHYGADAGSWANMVANILNNFLPEIRSANTIELQRDNFQLADIDDWFRGYFERRKLKAEVFYEEPANPIFKIVAQSSADPKLPGVNAQLITRGHFGIPKIPSEDDDVYRFTKRMIERCIDASTDSEGIIRVSRNESQTIDKPEEIRNLFISYSHRDSEFVDKLYDSLTAEGLRVWRDVNDLGDAPAGPLDKVLLQEMQNKVVLIVLSENSIGRPWVRFESQNAVDMGIMEGRDSIIPISLDDSFKNYDWPLRLQQQLYNYNILNFSQWSDEAVFDKRFGQILNGLELYY